MVFRWGGDMRRITEARSDRALGVTFQGAQRPVAGLTFRTILATIFTLGVYRFWMTTHLRQYYWSNTYIDNDPLEYDGTGAEKLIGFCVAIVFLAPYLFFVTMAVGGFSLATLTDPVALEAAFSVSLLAVLPLIPFAQYRAERYILSRTRWRSVRFGVEKGALTYAACANLWALASLLTLGLTAPLATVSLRRFITRRIRFGDRPLDFEGGAGALYPTFLSIWGAVVAIVALIIWRISDTLVIPPSLEPDAYEFNQFLAQLIGYGPMIVLGYIAIFLLTTYYGVYRRRFIVNCMRIRASEEPGGTVRLASDLSVVGYVWALVWRTICLAVLVGGLLLALGLLMVSLARDLAPAGGARDPGQVQSILIGAIILFYLVAGVAATVLSQAMLTLPLYRRFATAIGLRNGDALEAVRQRGREASGSAEGFADAIDVGAAF